MDQDMQTKNVQTNETIGVRVQSGLRAGGFWGDLQRYVTRPINNAAIRPAASGTMSGLKCISS